MIQITFLPCQTGHRCAFVDELIIVVPIPIGTRIDMRLVGIMLMPSNLDTGRFTTQVVQALVQANSIVERVAIEGARQLEMILQTI